MKHLLTAIAIGWTLIFAKQGVDPGSYTFTIGPGEGDRVTVYFTNATYVAENVAPGERTVTRDGNGLEDGLFECGGIE